MKNKQYDVIYCGVNEDKIINSNPTYDEEKFKMFYKFITERYEIHKRKDVLKLERPWTEDYALSNFKFCNVRREHDRTSRWLIEHISHSDESLETKVYKSILFRIYNRLETAQLIGLDSVTFFKGDWVERVSSILLDKSNYPEGYRFFTNAYKTGGTTHGFKLTFGNKYDRIVLPLHAVKLMMDNNLFESLINSRDQLDCYEILKCRSFLKGIGNFIGYQIFVDLTYIPEFKYSENEFTVAGPGCYYGLNMLFTDWDGLSAEELLFWLRNNFQSECKRNNLNIDYNKLFDDLPEYDRCLNVMMLENCFCEFQKYIRGNTENMTNPRNRYHEFVHAFK